MGMVRARVIVVNTRHRHELDDGRILFAAIPIMFISEEGSVSSYRGLRVLVKRSNPKSVTCIRRQG